MYGFTIADNGKLTAPRADYEPGEGVLVLDSLREFLAVRELSCPVWDGIDVREATADELALWKSQGGHEYLRAAAIIEALENKIGFFGAPPVAQQKKADHNDWASLSDVVAALVALGLFDEA